jgi:hypothetical protein
MVTVTVAEALRVYLGMWGANPCASHERLTTPIRRDASQR